MPLTKLQFRPGINRETTSYTNEGGWFDCDKVRFRFGYPEKIGGWIKRSSNSFLGSCRALHPWVTLSGNSYIGVGTHLKYYVNEGGGYNDVTPLRSTTAAGDVTFAAADDTLSANVAVNDTTISLTSASGFPETGIIKINSEIIEYAAVSGNDLTGLCAWHSRYDGRDPFVKRRSDLRHDHCHGQRPRCVGQRLCHL
jgi:hypothetical protein